MKTTPLPTRSPAMPPPLPLPPPPLANGAKPAGPKPTGFPKTDAVEIAPTAPKKADPFTWGPSLQQVSAGKASLHMGQKGPAVSDVQKKLGIPATGKFDKNTEVAVALFQKKEGLPTTGTVDAKTQKALDSKGVMGGGAAPPAKTTGADGASAGSAGATASSSQVSAAPSIDASDAEKYDYATKQLQSGLKPGKSAAADAIIQKMIDANGPAITSGEGSQTNVTLQARERFLKAAADAGYAVPKQG